MYTKLSKYISYLLRHNPGDLDLKMDSSGWVNCNELIDKIRATNKYIINMTVLKQIVKTDDKQRYSFSKDGNYIRANQGHSVNVDLGFTPLKPPDILYHGTSGKAVRGIAESHGLKPMSRQHVHLSTDIHTAAIVGLRHGRDVVVFCINAKQMFEDNYSFYKSENDVWLTKEVPSKYICKIKIADKLGRLVDLKDTIKN